MRAAFKILADGRDVTEVINRGLVSVTVTDKAGRTTDEVSFVFHDRDRTVALPTAGGTVEVWLGWTGTPLIRMGRYTVGPVKVESPPRRISITARAADLRAGLKAQTTKSWEGRTVDAIVETIATRHGYQAAVAAELRGIEPGHLDQVDESDAHFLTRLARDVGGTFKVAENRLILALDGAGRSVSGQTLSAATIVEHNGIRWSGELLDRPQYGSVVAHYHDAGAAERRTVTVGEGEPVYRIPRGYKDADTAGRAARSQFTSLSRRAGKMTLSLSYGRPEIGAETPVTVEGFDPAFDGQWVATEVTHTFDSKGGLSTVLELGPPRP